MKQLALCVLVAAMAAGCASSDTKDAPVADISKGTPSTTAQGTTGSTSGVRPGGNLGGTAQAGDDLRNPNSPLAKRSVYFDYDSNAVKDDYRGLVTAHSRYMTGKGDTKIRIEGNADERGSREYNLALGQRRAEAVKRVMTVLGVPDSRIETTSYGEEKPKSNGHDESAWAENRRADIRYAGE
jgi:peptidoglycan-associated lipoprotein